VQDAGRHHVVGVVAPAQQLRDLERVQGERRAVGLPALAAVAVGGEGQRGLGDRQVLYERRVGERGRHAVHARRIAHPG
jgi:hypothetical protein